MVILEKDIENAARAIQEVAWIEFDEQGSEERDMAFARAALNSYDMSLAVRIWPTKLKEETIHKCLTWNEPSAPTEMLHLLCSELLDAGREIANLRAKIAATCR